MVNPPARRQLMKENMKEKAGGAAPLPRGEPPTGRRGGGALPEQLNSCFCTSATLRPRSSAGDVHWVNRPTVGLCLSH